MSSLHTFCQRASRAKTVGLRGGQLNATRSIACEQQTHFRSSLLSLSLSVGEKRRPEMRLLFAGYAKYCRRQKNSRSCCEKGNYLGVAQIE